ASLSCVPFSLAPPTDGNKESGRRGPSCKASPRRRAPPRRPVCAPCRSAHSLEEAASPLIFSHERLHPYPVGHRAWRSSDRGVTAAAGLRRTPEARGPAVGAGKAGSDASDDGGAEATGNSDSAPVMVHKPPLNATPNHRLDH